MTTYAMPARARKLPTWGYVVIVVVYLAIVQFGNAIATSGLDWDYGKFRTNEQVLRALTIPVGASMIFAVIVATVLGWWGPIWKDDRPVQKWVRIVPGLLLAAIVIGTNYPELSNRNADFVLLFIVSALMVGFTEELVFRGIGVIAFRANGFPEARVALWTCLIFGLAHGTNIFVEGPSAIGQVLATAIAGFFFYLVRRSTGYIVFAMALHGLWDFGLFTSNLVKDELYWGAALFILADIVLAILLLVRRHHIELEGSTY
ncbi:MAG: CPBP family intramembrane glutamic endopeptidase [Acidimicrobiia bacterium]